MFTSNADIEGDLVIFVLLGSLKDLVSTWHNILYAKSGKIVTQTAESPGHTMNVVWHSCFFRCFVIVFVTHKIWEIMSTSLIITENTTITDAFCYSGYTGVIGQCNYFTDVKKKKTVMQSIQHSLMESNEYPLSSMIQTYYIRTASI